MFIRSGFMALLVFFVCLPAYACGPDANTPEKLTEKQRQRFEAIDKNSDDLLSVDEYEGEAKKRPYIRHIAFGELDKNSNGALDFDEWAANEPLSGFAELDCGNDM